MLCKHLYTFESELIKAGIRETYRGQPWTTNCREWVYFNCVFTNPGKTISRLALDQSIIIIHSHIGTHDGQEYGLICTACNDGIMGIHPDFASTMTPSPPFFE